MTKIRIIEQRFYNGSGRVTQKSYRLETLERFLFWRMWRQVKEWRTSRDGGYWGVIHKDSLEELEPIIDSLVAKTPRNRWVTEIVEERSYD